MANKDYSYAQVKGGTGTYKKESPTAYSSGVEQMQKELESCGYPSTDTKGHFGQKTYDALYAFQSNIKGLGADGIAGQNSLTVLSKVKDLKYFNDHGKPITAAEWTTAKIKGYTPRNVMSRVIYAEDTGNINGQKGVACVIKNRSGNSSYKEAGVSNAYIAVVVKTNQYGTVNGDANAIKPLRGDFSNKTDFTNSFWKSAVDLGETLASGGTLSYPSGYAVSGKSVSSTPRTITTGHYMQVGKSKYYEYVDANRSMSNILTFASSFSGSANVFFLA